MRVQKFGVLFLAASVAISSAAWAESGSKKKSAERRAEIALEDAEEAKARCEMAREKASRAKQKKTKKKLNAEAEEICEECEIAQKLADRYQKEADEKGSSGKAKAKKSKGDDEEDDSSEKKSSKGSAGAKKDEMVTRYHSRKRQGLDFKLISGFQYSKGQGSVYPDALLAIGYRWSFIGAYVTGSAVGALIESHLFLVNDKSFALSLNLGLGIYPPDSDPKAARAAIEFNWNLGSNFYLTSEVSVSGNNHFGLTGHFLGGFGVLF